MRNRLTSPLVCIAGLGLIVGVAALHGVSLTRTQARAAESIADLSGPYTCPAKSLEHPEGDARIVQAAPPGKE